MTKAFRTPESFSFCLGEIKNQMNQFFRDMLDVLRLRFRPLETYQYTLAVYVVILLLCGISSAAVMQWGFDAEPKYPLKFTSQAALLVFSVCLVVVQWASLGWLLPKFLKHFGGHDVRLYGYLLVTQAFGMFAVVFLYLPKEMLLLASIWQMWTLWVQLYGLFYIAAPEINGWKVLLSYVLAYMIFSFVMVLVGSVFLMTGQIDDTVLQQEMQRMMQEQQQQLQQKAK